MDMGASDLGRKACDAFLVLVLPAHAGLLSNLRRPRSASMGTIAFSCLGASGWASGSVFAAAVIALSSAAVGIATDGESEGCTRSSDNRVLDIEDRDRIAAQIVQREGRCSFGHRLIVRSHPAGANILPAVLDRLDHVQIVEDVLKTAIVRQTVKKSTNSFLGPWHEQSLALSDRHGEVSPRRRPLEVPAESRRDPKERVAPEWVGWASFCPRPSPSVFPCSLPRCVTIIHRPGEGSRPSFYGGVNEKVTPLRRPRRNPQPDWRPRPEHPSPGPGL